MTKRQNSLKFIDLFAGCGGISIGLLNAGLEGVFAIEKSELAFATLKHNLIDGQRQLFNWPKWLPKTAMTCENLLSKYADELGKLSGKIDLIVGGPPCQGFSTAGKRDPTDPRNKMTEQYLSVVGLVRPNFIVIENVAGFDMKFDDELSGKLLTGGGNLKSYAEYIAIRLSGMGYKVSSGLINCADFGVPQNRMRFLMICEKSNDASKTPNLMDGLKSGCFNFRAKRNLPVDRYVSTKEAISDLELSGKKLIPCADTAASGFMEQQYVCLDNYGAYQTQMRKGFDGPNLNSMRLARHKKETIEYFKKVQKICRPGRCLSIKERKKVGTRKHSTTVLDPNAPSPTITTLPDDIVHYAEPRILTVRESARLQSFPDWFEFRGKYTTGGKMRKHECPRYTQVGNAVPPLLSEALGELILRRVRSKLRTKVRRKKMATT